MKRRGLLWRLLAIGVLSIGGGCTAVTYDGPVRPDSEVATVHLDGLRLSTLNGKSQRSAGPRATYKIGPGTHVMSVVLADMGLTSTPVDLSHPFVAGKTYIARPMYIGGGWKPYIVESKN